MTLVMTFGVRALSVFLTVWLAAAAALPPCCWTMTYAHEHQQTASGVSSDAATDHHHHGSVESVAPAGPQPVLSPVPAYDCDGESAEAATITSTVRLQADARLAGESGVDIVAPPISAHIFSRTALSPPGASSSAAFLSPLRI